MAAQGNDSIDVSLITFYPGPEAFEVFGHTEIRVKTASGDHCFNYGVFDFNTPGFALRFALGKTDYLCQAIPSRMATVGNEGRRMVEQKLRLQPDQAKALQRFLVNNAQPENATYRYKFLSDNCATRPRDIIERFAGPSMSYFMPNDVKTDETFRQLIAQNTRNYPWLQFGIDLVLGYDIDTATNARQQLFLPIHLMDAVAGASVNQDGKKVALVETTNVLVDTPPDAMLQGPTPWYLTPMAAAVAWLLLTLLLTAYDLSRRRLSRWFDRVFFVIYGLGGCVIWFLVFLSTHEATTHNLNACWLNPLLLLLALLPAGKWLKTLHALNLVVVVALLLAWHWLPQCANAAFFPLMAASALRSWCNTRLL